MRKALGKILAIVTLLAFVHLVCANTLFMHSHRIFQGTITHSHPYNPYGQHAHNAADFQFIIQSNLTATTALAQTIQNAVEKPVLQHITLSIKPIQGYVGNHHLVNPPLRAPPAAA